ncbi:UDP-4-amino-4,6-dideoxy-N-acetyl-beta-L-altrosamine transaminase [Candidatus Woesearchaeota archaeon]|nr:MAG: UDP-4-amino-4,6-dideoxy-N-acetyl-beta-L-altrosamine transaminase [Candidatus Woesearchaeota archaeon]
MKIPYFRAALSDAEIAEVTDTLRSGWLTTGPKVKRFESLFAETVGVRHAIAVNSCTAALHLALEAVGLKQNDLVVVPTMTFAATAEVVRYFDATSVFVDCSYDFNMDPDYLETTILNVRNSKPVAGLKPPYGRLKAIIPMHYGGYCCDMHAINQIAANHGVDIIEDAAHAFPAYFRSNITNDWVHAGTSSRIGCFSFYANKCITTGEGGMAVTDDEQIAERIRIMSLHGMNNDAWKRFTAQGSWYYEIVAPGFKYNMTDIAAAIGLHQIKQAEEFRISRQKIAERYTERFKQLSALEPPPNDPQTRIHSWHLYALRLNLDQLTIDRAVFIEKLKERGVSCSVHWMPLHLHPYYRQTFGLGEGMFPIAEREWRRLVSLPIYPSMTEDEIDYVIEVVQDVTERFSK